MHLPLPPRLPPDSAAGSEYEADVAPRQAPKNWPGPAARPAAAQQAVSERRSGPNPAARDAVASLMEGPGRLAARAAQQGLPSIF